MSSYTVNVLNSEGLNMLKGAETKSPNFTVPTFRANSIHNFFKDANRKKALNIQLAKFLYLKLFLTEQDPEILEKQIKTWLRKNYRQYFRSAKIYNDFVQLVISAVKNPPAIDMRNSFLQHLEAYTRGNIRNPNDNGELNVAVPYLARLLTANHENYQDFSFDQTKEDAFLQLAIQIDKKILIERHRKLDPFYLKMLGAVLLVYLLVMVVDNPIFTDAAYILGMAYVLTRIDFARLSVNQQIQNAADKSEVEKELDNALNELFDVTLQITKNRDNTEEVRIQIIIVQPTEQVTITPSTPSTSMASLLDRFRFGSSSRDEKDENTQRTSASKDQQPLPENKF